MLMDGYTFTTFNGRVACWSLFGASLIGGTAVMLSALDATMMIHEVSKGL